MKISLEELEEGDEIIISSYSSLKYMRVLKAPEISNNRKRWSTNEFKWKNVKCLISKKEFESNYNPSIKYKRFDFDPDDLNTVIYKDLNDRDIWIVKRERTAKKEELVDNIIKGLKLDPDAEDYIFCMVKEALMMRTIKDLKQINS